jgi:hypothetical protein
MEPYPHRLIFVPGVDRNKFSFFHVWSYLDVGTFFAVFEDMDGGISLSRGGWRGDCRGRLPSDIKKYFWIVRNET